MNTKKNKFFLLSGFTWILLVLTNYQIIFFLPASILTLFILKKDDLRKNLLNFIYLFISILISIFIMIFLLNLHGLDINFISSKGSNISKEYLFSNTNYSGLYGFVFFIVNNLTEVTYSVLAMCNIPENYHLIFIIFVYFFSILGIFNLYKNNKLVFYFTISSLVIFLLFFFLSILAFSPTRHIIWLLFFLGILISYGFNFFIELTKYKKIFYIAILILSVANFTLFFSEYSSIKKDREDPLLNLNIKEIISSNKINLIATYQLSYNLNFNPFVKKYFNQVYNRNGLEILIERNTKLKDYNNINLLLYCSNGEPCINKSDKQIYKIKNQIEKIFNKNFTNIVLQKNKSNNVITKTSETFGNFTINNRKVQIFEIYTLY
jgi:4-amino-4-deoxy-L-arabinose transferase-like glycosyltransferase